MNSHPPLTYGEAEAQRPTQTCPRSRKLGVVSLRFVLRGCPCVLLQASYPIVICGRATYGIRTKQVGCLPLPVSIPCGWGRDEQWDMQWGPHLCSWPSTPVTLNLKPILHLEIIIYFSKTGMMVFFLINEKRMFNRKELGRARNVKMGCLELLQHLGMEAKKISKMPSQSTDVD